MRDDLKMTMSRRGLLVSLVALGVGMAGPARADAAADVVRQLRALGYTDFDVRRTLLGRVQIVATSATRRREIILNPRTGEILRDIWQPISGGSGGGGGGGGVTDPGDSDDDRGDDNDSGGGGGGGDDGGDSGGDDGDSDG